jgi:hypothetical protein
VSAVKRCSYFKRVQVINETTPYFLYSALMFSNSETKIGPKLQKFARLVSTATLDNNLNVACISITAVAVTG